MASTRSRFWYLEAPERSAGALAIAAVLELAPLAVVCTLILLAISGRLDVGERMAVVVWTVALLAYVSPGPGRMFLRDFRRIVVYLSLGVYAAGAGFCFGGFGLLAMLGCLGGCGAREQFFIWTFIALGALGLSVPMMLRALSAAMLALGAVRRRSAAAM